MPTLIDEVSSTLSYIGIAPEGVSSSDPVWEILKLDTTSGLSLTKTMNAKDRKGAIWDDRTTDTYG
jgi:hypothetical protein